MFSLLQFQMLELFGFFRDISFLTFAATHPAAAAPRVRYRTLQP